jgi:DNA polymerase elongation subunit (family B)
MEHIFRIIDFNVYNEKSNDGSSSEDEKYAPNDASKFVIQMFGVNEEGETCSIIAEDYKPFFYVMVNDSWNLQTKNQFLEHLKAKIGKYYEKNITECIIVKRKKLYGFDGGKEHKFIKLQFSNLQTFNKVKNLWYTDYQYGHVLLQNGYQFPLNSGNYTKLYEANIPPLLRFFHIRDISPSGWVALPKKRTIEFKGEQKKTSCKYELSIHYKYIIPLNDKETRVPYKIMSFDIEASSSHGDFPIPIKSYKKLATNIVEYFETLQIEITQELCKNLLRQIIMTAFGYDNMENIDVVYPKKHPGNKPAISQLCEKWLLSQVRNIEKTDEFKQTTTIESLFEKMALENNEEDDGHFETQVKAYTVKKATIVDILCDKNFEREGKLNELNISLNAHFPRLEGDKVTFIGSTFMNYGEKEPFMNHCIVLNTCEPIPMENSIVETYNTEKDVLLAWQKLVQRENPDIVIGYNIFGFDYEFMFRRAEENNCVEEFMKLSRNKEEMCCTKDNESGRYKIEESTIQIASGQHDLRFIKMNGRLQVDLYNYYRREANLTSYKLDYVAGNFIGDFIKSFLLLEKGEQQVTNCKQETEIKTSNMTGLLIGSYVHFEEIAHSVDYYADGAKFLVTHVDKKEGNFRVEGNVSPDMTKKVRWCLAKDDVTPKDIFRLTNGTSRDRSIIAKYCIQDCNLVHYLFNKSDVLTGFIEMAKICSVPINFLVMRGQGIKLTSYVAKKCREKRTLIPVIEKGSMDEGYEGAIVLEPKCHLYLDNPVACVDYASLYPSSMISENLSHDSKVWTKEYDLAGNLIEEWGEKDKDGNFMYDELPGYDYVNCTYDTYRYIRKTPKSAAEKVKAGHKICRFAQFPDGKAIMPSILEELLVARKTTRKLIPQQTDDFMKQILDQRQLGYKVTANSLYGQCGAKTSTFYEKDIAACTTATGRMLLIYAKKIIEECYGDKICQTKEHGPVLTKAEYIYGDSVANYTPVYISTFKNSTLKKSTFKKSGAKEEGEEEGAKEEEGERIIDIIIIEELANKYGNNNWVKCSEPGKQEKEFCELEGVETWTDKGWTKLHRVIRHELASHKKMVRISTHTGLIDVTDDHSLILKNGQEISPKDVNIGTELLHNSLLEKANNAISVDGLFSMQFDNMLEAAIYVNYLNSINHHDYYIESFHNNSILISVGLKKTNINSIKQIQEINYSGYVYDLTTDNHHFAAGVGDLIVHNTDSVFFTFNLQTPEGKPIRGKEALEITIELAQEAGHLASSFLKQPHDLEYEKTFMPFCLLSKKRYVGMLYETDPNKCKRKEMGIVLKRRDNAPIVKDIYGGIIDILMKQQNIGESIDFLRNCLQNIVDEKYPIEKLIITKSLRTGYKNPNSIAHKVLADRITARDPGSKPSSGDRIPFVYINTQNKKALQGEKIETPSFIMENNLKIDYSFYITNQIMKPVQQLFALVLEKIWEMQKKKCKISNFKKEVDILRKNFDDEKFQDKLEKLKNKEVKTLLFDEYLRETNNEKEGVQSLTKYFSKK